MSKYEYFKPDSAEAKAAFDAQWPPIEARLKKLLPLTDDEGKPVQLHTQIICIDFSKVADAHTGQQDTAGLTERFMAMVEKKDGAMTVEKLLARDAAELTRWRKMGNSVTLFPNALVLHMNSK